MKSVRLYLIIFFLLISSSFRIFSQKLNCSAFVAHYNKVVLGKNLDWELGNGLIVFNPKNKAKKSVVARKPLNWKSKFCSITFNQFGKNLPLGGMNEAGLVIEELSTWPVDYPNDTSLSCLNEFEWVQYNLDSYASISEVIENVDNYSISKFFFGLHFIIADSSGNSAIVEFINGKAEISLKNNFPFLALTNNNYKELLKSYNYYLNSRRNELNISQSQDRFIKLIHLLKSNSVSTSFSAMNILDSVKVDDTRWQIVYNASDLEIYYKTDLISRIDTISFSEFNLSSNKYLFKDFYSIKASEFNELSKEENNKYLNSLVNVFARSDKTEILSNKINNLIK
jgi:penicillin V acylase-like amidase (Ntn superfamily)